MRRLVLGLLLFSLGLGSATLVASPRAGARSAVDGTLTGGVGSSGSPNGYTISLSASTVPAGTYELDITDYATIHNFDLLDQNGTSVDRTSISGTGSASWVVDLTPGTYTFHCDAHPATMKGTLTVTGGTTSTATTTTGTGTTTTTTTTPPTTTPPPTTAPPTTTAGATAPPTTTTTPTTTQAALRGRIVSAHATRRGVVVTVATNQLARAVGVLLDGKKRLAVAAKDSRPGSLRVTLRLRPARRLASGRYLVRVKVACCGTSVTITKAIRIR